MIDKRIEFNATAGGYFKIWIVNTLLSIITFGLYSPWAKVRTKKYFNQSTRLNDSSFDYHAKPTPILYGRLIALFLFMSYSAIANFYPLVGVILFYLLIGLVPFIVLKSFKFNISNTSYKNIRFKLKAQTKDIYQVVGKYFSFPVIVGILSSLILMLNPGLFEKGNQSTDTMSKVYVISIIVGYLVVGLYMVFISSKVMNALFNLVYNNLYYGNLKINFDTSAKEVSRNITRPYFMMAFFGIVVILASILLVGFISQTYPIFKVLLPFVFIFGYIFAIYVSLKLPYSILTYVWSRFSCDVGKSKTDLTFGNYLKVSFTNMIAVGFSLGLLYPWAKVRMLKLKLESRIFNMESLDKVEEAALNEENAIADEVVDVFDFDFEFGL